MIILVPMAGEGTRTKESHTEPKPMIPIGERPMFYHAVISANQLNGHKVFIVRSEHNIVSKVKDYFPHSTVIEQQGRLNGAVLSCLLAKDLIDDQPLLIMDCDMAVNFNYWDMFKVVSDVGVVTFLNTNPAYSYVISDFSKRILKIAEKNPISDKAVAGSFFWKRGTDFVRLAEKVISRPTASEMYLSEVIKEAITEGLVVRQYDAVMAYDLSTESGQNQYLNDLH